MAEVYGATTDKILINLAKYFKYMQMGAEVPGAFEYQARMLAQMGQVNRETVQIIMQNMGGADAALKASLEAAILDALKNEEPKLQRAAKQGLLWASPPDPEITPNQMQAFQAYYRQSADKLNLVNTVMLESTETAYRATVADVAQKIQRTQGILNTSTGEVVTGVTSYNQAVRDAVRKMVDNGLTGFIDHGGHRWSPEAYAAMDIKTTMFNTARAAVWEREEEYGCDTYQVSSHNGARPLCYPWQGKVISRTDNVREIEDLDGNKIHVYAQSETSYGAAAGLFGVNCGHYPMTFIPGFSTMRGEPQDEAENEKTYAESQQQRALERKLREEKRDLEVMKAQGAPEEQIRAQKERVKQASRDIDDFCDDTGRTRRRDREGAPVRATWPVDGGEVTRYNGGYIGTNETPPPKNAMTSRPVAPPAVPTPITPVTPAPVAPAPVAPAAPAPQNVAQQATQTAQNAVQSQSVKPDLKTTLANSGIPTVDIQKWDHTPTQDEIISAIGGADQTSGSCASVSLAYAGNKAGYTVHDFRGGSSMDWFATKSNTQMICELPDIGGTVIVGNKEIEIANQLLAKTEQGKEYWLGIGRHASIVRKTATGYEYLELQSATDNGWHTLDNDVFRWRFGCVGKRGHDLPARLMEVDKMVKSQDFIDTLKYINTDVSAQRKGVGGGIK